MTSPAADAIVPPPATTDKSPARGAILAAQRVLSGHGLPHRHLALTGNVRIFGSPEYICAPFGRRALTRSASADLHRHPAGADRQSRAARQGRAKRAAKRRP